MSEPVGNARRCLVATQSSIAIGVVAANELVGALVNFGQGLGEFVGDTFPVASRVGLIRIAWRLGWFGHLVPASQRRSQALDIGPLFIGEEGQLQFDVDTFARGKACRAGRKLHCLLRKLPNGQFRAVLKIQKIDELIEQGA